MKCEDIFNTRYVLPPRVFKITNYPRDPVAVFNPGAVIVDDTVHVFPRIVFDYYKYTSAVGHFSIGWDDLVSGRFPRDLEIEIIIWPKTKEEFLGCEDPRVVYSDGEFWFLYTGKGFKGVGEGERTDFLTFVRTNERFEVLEKHFVKLEMNDEEFYPRSNKDSAFIEIVGREATVLTRPDFGGRLSGWRGILDMERWVIRELEEVLPPKTGELKRGWSTNTVRIDDGYLVGWHAVLDGDLSYRNGLAIVDRYGKVLSQTPYVLCPKGLVEELGDRAMVIFGNGLIVKDGVLVWIGGVSDYAVGIFISELERVLERMN